MLLRYFILSLTFIIFSSGHDCPGRILDLNDPDCLLPVINCTIIEGVLIVRNLHEACCHDTKCSLPNLVEISGTLLVEYGNCSSDLSIFLPNLTVIRNWSSAQTLVIQPFPVLDYALIVRHTKLRALGLLKLKMLSSNRIAIIDNPLMCYTDTIDWNSLTNTSIYESGPSYRFGSESLIRFGLGSFCSDICPAACRSVEPKDVTRSYCWSNTSCQSKCSSICSSRYLACDFNNPQLCCDPECAGGCHGPLSSQCVACKHAELNGTCLSHCPKSYYLLHGHHCVTKEQCINRPGILEKRFNETAGNYSILNSTCVLTCPSGHLRSSTGECIPCPDSMCIKQACGDLRVYKISDFEQVRGCVTAQSLLISVRDCEDADAKLFMDAFSSLEEIYVSLHIISSDSLASLAFLRSIRKIHGLRRDGTYSNYTTQTVLEIAWNSQLKKLWIPKHSKLALLSGRVVFTLNRNLCPEQIQNFLSSYVELSRELTSLESNLVDKSNGAVGICRGLTLNLTVHSVHQRSVHLYIESPAWSDPRQVLPTTVFYRQINNNEPSDLDQTICDTAWNIREPICQQLDGFSGSDSVILTDQRIWKLGCILGHLNPARRYQAYVEIRTMINREGALSSVFAFETKPDTPGVPTDFRAFAISSNKIQLYWNIPDSPNGHIVKYHISYRRLSFDSSTLNSQATCSNVRFSSNSLLNSPTSIRHSKNFHNPANNTHVYQMDNLNYNDNDHNLINDEEVCSCTSCVAFCFASTNKFTHTQEEDIDNPLKIDRSTYGFLTDDVTRNERRDMIRFEDSLQNLLIYSRVKQVVRERQTRSLTGKSFNNTQSFHNRSYPYSSSNSDKFIPGLIKSRSWDKHISYVVKSVNYSALSILISGLHHYTEYLFAISACHQPHDSSGYVFPQNFIDFELDSIDEEPWCSSRAVVWQRTEPSPFVDNIDVNSVELIAESVAPDDCRQSNTFPPHSSSLCSPGIISTETVNSTSGIQSTKPVQHSSLIVSTLRWRPPPEPNGLTLYYWIRYRRVEAPFQSFNSDKDKPNLQDWSLLCTVADNMLISTAIESSSKNVIPSISVKLYDLRPGTYEFQVMSVSLAGNGSWTEVKIFEVKDVQSKWDFILEHYYILVITFIVNLVLVILAAIYIERRTRRKRLRNNSWTHKLWEVVGGDVSREWKISVNDLTWDMNCVLGRGSFGMVYRGRLTRLTTPAARELSSNLTNNNITNTTSNGTPNYTLTWSSSGLQVAVKTMSPASNIEDIRDFFSEVCFMKEISCHHIVRFLGIVPRQSSIHYPAIVMEFMAFGDLATYLRQRMSKDDCTQGSIQPQLAVNWAAQLADGMYYLTNINIVHRDLAARNCLVDTKLTVKIGDFGLARQLNEQEYYRKLGQARLPIRWMSPEALSSAYFTTKSDIWSYGVVLWEIATFASLPYPGLSHEEVMNFVTNGGHLNRLDCPTKLPPILSKIMDQCWKFEPSERPDFYDILTDLEPFINNTFRSVSYFHSTKR